MKRAFLRIYAQARLQCHIAASLLKTRRMDFRGLAAVSSLSPGRRLLGPRRVVRAGGRWTGALGRLGWKATCLRRSMFFARVLRLEGYDAAVVLGARKGGEGMEGHSWVELDGEVIGMPGEGFAAVWGGGGA